MREREPPPAAEAETSSDESERDARQTSWRARWGITFLSWLGAVTGVLAFVLSYVQFKEGRREYVSVEIERYEKDYISAVHQPGGSRGRPPPQMEIVWRALISNDGDVPVSIVKLEASFGDSAQRLFRVESPLGKELELPWNVAAHTSIKVYLRSLLTVSTCVLEVEGVDQVRRTVPTIRASEIAWACFDSGTDLFGNRVRMPWGFPRLIDPDVLRNPKISWRVETSRGLPVSEAADWYGLVPEVWGARLGPRSYPRQETEE